MIHAGCDCEVVPVRLIRQNFTAPYASGGRWARFRTSFPGALPATHTTSTYQRFPVGRVVGMIVGPTIDSTAAKIVPQPNFEQLAGTSVHTDLYAGQLWAGIGGWATGTALPPNIGDPELLGGAACIPMGVFVPWYERVPVDPTLYLSPRPPSTNSVQIPDVLCVTVFVIPDVPTSKSGACP